MDNDKELLPLSWLSQANYCLRRAALLLNERVWVENSDTAKGRAEHERVHSQGVERRGRTVKLYEHEVVSQILGVSGKCDCVEATESPSGCIIPAADFPVVLYPIEYKHGRVREEEEYKIQLCAEAMCLEEMYHTHIAEAALFFISSHRRLAVEMTDELRQKVILTAEALRKVREQFTIPRAEYSKKCERCSLKEYCMPKAKNTSASYCERVRKEATGELSL